MSMKATTELIGKSILITGGAGFIGSHLVARLLNENVSRVVVVDSLRYGDPANLPASSDKVQVLKHTLGTDPVSKLQEALRGIDYVFHLAAEKHNQSKDTPHQVIRANIDGTLELYEQAAAAGVKKLVYTSSLYAYGRMQLPEFKETDVTKPHTIYGMTKLAGEYLCEYSRQQWGLQSTSLRYLFIYGPKQFAGMGYKSVIIKNFERIIAGQQPIVFGDGLQALDYVYVDDAVDATVRALAPEGNGEVFNVATGNRVTVLELINTMLKISGSQLTPVFEPADWTAGTVRVGIGQKLEKTLGWTPRVSLEEGLKRTYDWMIEQKGSK